MAVLNFILLLVYCSFLAIQLSAAAAAETRVTSKGQATSQSLLKVKPASEHKAHTIIGESANKEI